MDLREISNSAKRPVEPPTRVRIPTRALFLFSFNPSDGGIILAIASRKRFTKKIESFICENCGFSVSGKGYTNHCPKCLWSKHVDIFPGDRASECGGMMKPIAVEVKRDGFVIVHKCTKCGAIKRNIASSEDNFDELLKLIKKGKRKSESI